MGEGPRSGGQRRAPRARARAVGRGGRGGRLCRCPPPPPPPWQRRCPALSAAGAPAWGEHAGSPWTRSEAGPRPEAASWSPGRSATSASRRGGGRLRTALPFGIVPALPPLHGENSPTPFPVVTREPQLPPELRMELAKWKVVRSHSLVAGPLLPVSTTSCPQTLGFDEGNETHPPGVSPHPRLPVRGRKSGPKLGEISSILGW